MVIIIKLVFMLFFIACIIPFVLGIKYAKEDKEIKKAEKEAYETMVLSPNDTTVSNYIEIFLKSSNRVLKIAFGPDPTSNSYTNNEQEKIIDKTRQAQGYKIVIDSPNVSDQVKEQLRKAFIARGVPIL